MKKIVYYCNVCKQEIPETDKYYEITPKNQLLVPIIKNPPSPLDHLHICFCEKCLSDILCPPPKKHYEKPEIKECSKPLEKVEWVGETDERVERAHQHLNRELHGDFFDEGPNKDALPFHDEEYDFPELPSVEEDELEEPKEEPIPEPKKPEPKKQEPKKKEPKITEVKKETLDAIKEKYPDITIPVKAVKCMDPGSGVTVAEQNEMIAELFGSGMKIGDIARVTNTTWNLVNYRLKKVGRK